VDLKLVVLSKRELTNAGEDSYGAVF